MAFKDCSVKVTIFQFYLQFGITALHRAALNGKADVIEILLQHGADFTVKAAVRTELGISNDKTIFICHLNSLSLSTVVSQSRVEMQLDDNLHRSHWIRIHKTCTTNINGQKPLILSDCSDFRTGEMGLFGNKNECAASP